MTYTRSLRSALRTTVFAFSAIAGQTLFTSAIAQDDEIIVTATKRAQSLQDVPLAVTAVGEQQIERKGINDLSGLGRAAASFRIQNSQTETQGSTLRLRGVGTTGNNIGLESSVGVFLDGVYLSRPGVALADLVDVAQIEVIRGPQGTLFGRNTSAGALNITTKKPNLSDVEASAAATVGSLDSLNFQGSLSLPIVDDTFGVRIAGAVRMRDGVLDSVNDGDLNTRDRYLLRAQAYWDMSDAADFRLIFDYSDADEECCDAVILRETPLATLGAGAFNLVGRPGGGVGASGPQAYEDRLSNSQYFENSAKQWGVSGELNWDLGGAKLTYVGSWRDFSSEFVQDGDFSGLNAVVVGAGGFAAPGTPESGDDITLTTHELRLQGAMLDDRLDWLVGGFFSDEKIEETFTVTLGPDYQRFVGANIILAPGVFASFGSNPMLVMTSQGATFGAGPFVSANGNFATNHFEQDASSWSLFTHNVFKVTDWFDLTVGARYVSEDKDGAFTQLAATPFASSACGAVIANAPPAAPPPQIPGALATGVIGLTCFPFAVQASTPASAVLPLPRLFSNSFKDEELIYTFNGNFHLTDDVSAYAGYTHGFKSGGFNLDSTAAVGGADPRFRSEEVNAYEIGLKANLFDGRLRANIAGFHMKMTDFQVLEFTGIQFNTFNVPEALSTGAEAEFDASVTDWFSLNVGLAYADARYPSDCNAGLPASTPASLALSIQNLCGFQLTNAPKFTGTFGGSLETKLSENGWGVFAMASARYESDRRTSTAPRVIVNNAIAGLNPFDIQEANTKIDARVGVTTPDERWSLEGWVTNLTDERTRGITINIPLRGTGANAARGAFIEEPRIWGVTVRAKY